MINFKNMFSKTKKVKKSCPFCGCDTVIVETTKGGPGNREKSVAFRCRDCYVVTPGFGSVELVNIFWDKRCN